MRTISIAIAVATALSLCGCDSLARFTRVTSIPTSASARHNAQGEPGLVASGWGLPPADGRGFATYVHDPTVANGCSEWDSEPAAEIDNDGVLCRSFVP